MAFKCKIGLHSWNGCKCSDCEKTRDEQHDWSNDCEKCSKCGKTRDGNQEWMIKNLDIVRFRNGDLIPEVKIREDWNSMGNNGKPAWCYFDNDPSNGNQSGKIYNGHAIADPRGLAPLGYHIPTQKEFEKLIQTVKGHGNALKSIGQGIGKGSGSNESGFSAIIAGFRGNAGYFVSKGERTGFWSLTLADSSNRTSGFTIGPSPYSFWMEVDNTTDNIYINNNGFSYGFSVRCVKD